MLNLSRCKTAGLEIAPAEPLWKRVPARDEDGSLLCDFMMFIPGLNKHSVRTLKEIVVQLEKIFGLYQSWVVFADLNTDKNILWVSHRHKSGIALEIAAMIHELIPQARLVAQRYE